MNYNEWVKKAVTEDLQLNEWEQEQLNSILDGEDEDFVDVWMDSSGIFAERVVMLNDEAFGYAVLDGEHDCFSVFKDNGDVFGISDKYMEEDMILSEVSSELKKKYPEWVDEYEELENALKARYKAWYGVDFELGKAWE